MQELSIGQQFLEVLGKFIESHKLRQVPETALAEIFEYYSSI